MTSRKKWRVYTGDLLAGPMKDLKNLGLKVRRKRDRWTGGEWLEYREK